MSIVAQGANERVRRETAGSNALTSEGQVRVSRTFESSSALAKHVAKDPLPGAPALANCANPKPATARGLPPPPGRQCHRAVAAT